MTNLDPNLSTLAPFLSSRSEIVLAYLFGSAATDRTHRLSDIDIAVLVDEEEYAEQNALAPYGYRAELSSRLGEILQRDAVDVVLLNSATPLLAHEVVRTGKLLLCRDDDGRVDFEVRVHQVYADTRPLRAIQQLYHREAIGRATFADREQAP